MKKALFGVVLVLCALSLFISMGLFYNMAVFADETNCSPADVCGGDGWLLLDWLRMALLAVACVVCVAGLLARRKE